MCRASGKLSDRFLFGLAEPKEVLHLARTAYVNSECWKDRSMFATGGDGLHRCTRPLINAGVHACSLAFPVPCGVNEWLLACVGDLCRQGYKSMVVRQPDDTPFGYGREIHRYLVAVFPGSQRLCERVVLGAYDGKYLCVYAPCDSMVNSKVLAWWKQAAHVHLWLQLEPLLGCGFPTAHNSAL